MTRVPRDTLIPKFAPLALSVWKSRHFEKKSIFAFLTPLMMYWSNNHKNWYRRSSSHPFHPCRKWRHFRLAEIVFRKMTYIASVMRMCAYKPYIRDYRLADSTAVPAPVYLISAIIVSSGWSPPGGELLLLLVWLMQVFICLIIYINSQSGSVVTELRYSSVVSCDNKRIQKN